MILFGHLGLTLAAVKAIETATGSIKPSLAKNKIDYRMVLLGSILPDLIDKPLIFLTSNGVYSSGRVYGHSLLFFILLAITALLIKTRTKKNWALTIAAGSLIHILLDGMWNYPETLFWPVYPILTSPNSHSLLYWLTSMMRQNFGSLNNLLQANIELTLLIPEIIGLAILGLVFIRLILRRQVGNFLKSGVIP